MTLLIDADGCPVVDIAVRIAHEHHLECIILCDSAHNIERPGAKTITVSKGNDSVDLALVNRVKPGDIVITQDYGLAAMCLAKQAIPIHQNGMIYTNDNIDMLLNMRHISWKIRASGGRVKGPSKRQKAQDVDFEKALRGLLA